MILVSFSLMLLKSILMTVFLIPLCLLFHLYFYRKKINMTTTIHTYCKSNTFLINLLKQTFQFLIIKWSKMTCHFLIFVVVETGKNLYFSEISNYLAYLFYQKKIINLCYNQFEIIIFYDKTTTVLLN